MADAWRPTATAPALRKRAEVLAAVRAFFARRDVLEVETPLLAAAPVTDLHLHAMSCRYRGPGHDGGRKLWLQTSPEFAMKRLLAAGSGPIYQLCKAFRDGEAGSRHNPEFTILEWYRPGWDHHRLMDEVAELLHTVLGERRVGLAAPVSMPTGAVGAAVDPVPVPDEAVSEPGSVAVADDRGRFRFRGSGSGSDSGSGSGSGSGSERITYRGAMHHHIGIDPVTASLAEIADAAREHIDSPPDLGNDRDGWLDLLMSHIVEPKLGRGRPTFVIDYPASQAALARIRPGDPPVAERFEVYVEGVELANGYHELAEPAEQRRRFGADLAARRDAGLPEVPIDERLLAALEHGMPDCAGVALGVDRLVMLAAGAERIDEVIAFPIDRA
ncbi:MAG: EF-P lysine aminoacylase EpmA [Thermoanaerobaculales bacterium]|jgi:lysyl-tRNA synthetase class 2|nr:EF-P lysine aminoacylase EpmA [Thermoanaerobaculales bacterium]